MILPDRHSLATDCCRRRPRCCAHGPLEGVLGDGQVASPQQVTCEGSYRSQYSTVPPSPKSFGAGATVMCVCATRRLRFVPTLIGPGLGGCKWETCKKIQYNDSAPLLFNLHVDPCAPRVLVSSCPRILCGHERGGAGCLLCFVYTAQSAVSTVNTSAVAPKCWLATPVAFLGLLVVWPPAAEVRSRIHPKTALTFGVYI